MTVALGMALAVAVPGLRVPGLVAPARAGVYATGVVLIAVALGLSTLRRGTRVSVLTFLVAIAGAGTMPASLADPVMTMAAAAWLGLLPMLVFATLPGRAVWYLTAVSGSLGLVLTAAIPGPPVLAALRVAAVVALNTLPLVIFVLLRQESNRHLELAERMAVTDQLTGLMNRHGLNQHFPDWAARSAPGAAILLGDIDNFKRVNDTHGHARGDEVLRQVAECLRGRSRGDDLLVRLGGEEFAVFTACRGREDAVGHAERMRRAVEEVGGTGGTTISFGVSFVDARGKDPSDLLDTLLVQADHCLYRAKAGGRNRVVADGGAPSGGSPVPHPRTPGVPAPHTRTGGGREG